MSRGLSLTCDLDAEPRLPVRCVAGLSCSMAIAVEILVRYGVMADVVMAQVKLVLSDMIPNTRFGRHTEQELGLGRTIVPAVRQREAKLIVALELPARKFCRNDVTALHSDHFDGGSSVLADGRCAARLLAIHKQMVKFRYVRSTRGRP